MASKRKCLEEAEEERQPDVADATARLKALNTGRHVDAASRTQMLLRFGQRLQARRSKRQSQGPAAAPAGQCLQCQAVGRKAAVCAHCTGPMCAGCARPCCRCCRVFCATCTMLDYTAQETQSVCFDCSG
ncbi:hypothetical protein H4R21_004207 [Coemansia helicoidea]|uniref:Uncharacterized protein n=1 Tax=Coemansia helicoidea TaxID=1286919 RepID=A0ACC1KYJ1_9FUNG|nr:hypothetical protein H4R21_004207 [Coemansia helicoidea]